MSISNSPAVGYAYDMSVNFDSFRGLRAYARSSWEYLYANGAVPLRPMNDSPLSYHSQTLCPTIYESTVVLSSRMDPPLPALMSHTHPTPSSSSNFQAIFNAALKAYEKHTKKDLLAHPLAAELQSCSSPSAILAVLQQQVQELNRSRGSNEGLTKWLDPTVHVLHAFSGTLGEGIGLVCLTTGTRLGRAL
jgi:hypothetical protein